MSILSSKTKTLSTEINMRALISIDRLKTNGSSNMICCKNLISSFFEA